MESFAIKKTSGIAALTGRRFSPKPAFTQRNFNARLVSQTRFASSPATTTRMFTLQIYTVLFTYWKSHLDRYGTPQPVTQTTPSKKQGLPVKPAAVFRGCSPFTWMSFPVDYQLTLSLGGLVTDAAEGLRGHAQVGRDHPLRDPGRQLGIGLKKLKISFLGAQAKKGLNPALRGDEAVLQDRANQIVEGWDVAAQLLKIGLVDEDYFGVLQRIDIVIRWVARQQALPVARPPIFYRKAKDRLVPFFIYLINTYASFNNEGIVSPNVTFLQQILAFTQPFILTNRLYFLQLIRRQVAFFKDIFF